MERSELLTLFATTASEVAEKEFGAVGEDTLIADMGIDSLAMLEVVGEMEKNLSIQIPDDLLTGIETVGQLLDQVQKKLT